MVQKRFRPQDAWERWSYSKFTELYNCPLAFALRYIHAVPAPLKPINAFGIAMHYLFKRFFAVRFQSAESFAGAWTGFWMKVMNGECGPEKFGATPQPINWRTKEEAWYWHHQGNTAAKRFFEVHADLRGIGAAFKTEHRFAVPFSGLKVSGVFDRLDLNLDGRPEVTLVDYKPGRLPEYQQPMLQFLFYQLGYELIRHRLPRQPHLTRLRVYSYLPGEYSQDLPLARPEDLENLRQLLTEASWYVWSVQHKKKHPMLRLFPLKHFPEEDIVNGWFSPHLPKYIHCQYCTYVQQCLEWERGHERPSAYTAWVERLVENARARNATQMPIPIFPA